MVKHVRKFNQNCESFQNSTILSKQRLRIHHQYQTSMVTVPSRDKIKIGVIVQIVQKQDQRTGNLTEGIVKRILTSSNFHPHGIKVELDSGKIGRVQNIT